MPAFCLRNRFTLVRISDYNNQIYYIYMFWFQVMKMQGNAGRHIFTKH